MYLAVFFPGVPVWSAQAHRHTHNKMPHHVVLQIPVKWYWRKAVFITCNTLTPPGKINYYSVLQISTLCLIKNRPFGVLGQYMVQSSEIVGSIVHDFLCLWYGDVDCIHYLRREVTPVKFLQKGWETKACKQQARWGKEGTKISVFYLWVDLNGEVGIEIPQLHLVVKKPRVVTVLLSICSLGIREEKKSPDSCSKVLLTFPDKQWFRTERKSLVVSGRFPLRVKCLSLTLARSLSNSRIRITSSLIWVSLTASPRSVRISFASSVMNCM